MAMLAAGIATPAAATDPLPGPGNPPGGPDTGIDPPPPVAVSGQILKNGHAARGDVIAYVWPNDEVLAALPEGAEVDVRPIAHTTSTAAGTYALRIDPAAIPADYKSRTGIVNIDVVSATSDSQVTWSTSLRAAGLTQGGWAAANDASTTATPTRLTTDVARGTVTQAGVQYNDGTGHVAQAESLERDQSLDAVISHINRVPSSGSVASASTSAAPMGCVCCATWRKRGLKTGVSTRVLKAQALSNVPVTVEFGTNASYTLGMAMDVQGKLSTSGEKTIETGAGASNTYKSTRSIYNKYNYRAYRYEGCIVKTKWQPESANAFLTSALLVARSDYATCETHSSGTFYKQRGKNFTQKGGVSFPGIKLDAQAGFNGKVKLTWKFSSRAKLCGSSSLGYASAPWAGPKPA